MLVVNTLRHFCTLSSARQHTCILHRRVLWINPNSSEQDCLLDPGGQNGKDRCSSIGCTRKKHSRNANRSRSKRRHRNIGQPASTARRCFCTLREDQEFSLAH